MSEEPKPDDSGVLLRRRDRTDHLWPLTREHLLGLDAHLNGLMSEVVCKRYRFRLTVYADGTITACSEFTLPIVKD